MKPFRAFGYGVLLSALVYYWACICAGMGLGNADVWFVIVFVSICCLILALLVSDKGPIIKVSKGSPVINTKCRSNQKNFPGGKI